jgi:hypothetical protein
LARLRGNGRFTIPTKMVATLNQYRRENSKTLGFLQDRVVLHRSLDTGNLPGVEVVNGDVSHVFCDGALLQELESGVAQPGQEAAD